MFGKVLISDCSAAESSVLLDTLPDYGYEGEQLSLDVKKYDHDLSGYAGVIFVMREHSEDMLDRADRLFESYRNGFAVLIENYGTMQLSEGRFADALRFERPIIADEILCRVRQKVHGGYFMRRGTLGTVVSELLYGLGYRRRYSGFTELEESLSYLFRCGAVKYNLNRDIYPYVGRKLMQSVTAVERSIRLINSRVWSSAPECCYTELFGTADIGGNGLPTNKKLIAALCSYLNRYPADELRRRAARLRQITEGGSENEIQT